VLQHLRRGRTNGEIAEQLGVTLDAVKYHVSNMLGKLGLESREQLAELPSGSRLSRVWSGLPLLAKAGFGAAAAGVVAVAVAVPVGVLNPAPAAPPVPLFDGLVTTTISGDPVYYENSRPQLSADGRYVLFESSSPDLVPKDNNGKPDVFRFDRQTKELRLVSGDGRVPDLAEWSGAASMSADGRFVAYSSSGSNPGELPVRIRDMESNAVREIPGGRSPVISPDGNLLAYLLGGADLEADATLEVLDLSASTVIWRTTVSRELNPMLAPGFLVFSGDSGRIVFQAGAVPGVSCDPAVLMPINVGGEERVIPLLRPYVHHFDSGETRCLPLPTPFGGTPVDVGFVSISGDRAAVPYMTGERAGDVNRLLGSHLSVVDLVTLEVEVFDSPELSFCCGGPPAIAGDTVAWGPWRKNGIDLFERFPTGVPQLLRSSARFERDSVQFSQPSLSADGRHLAYVVSGRDINSGSDATEIYVISR
jgi:hypothetical protein